MVVIAATGIKLHLNNINRDPGFIQGILAPDISPLQSTYMGKSQEAKDKEDLPT
jgi:hypothetical protein